MRSHPRHADTSLRRVDAVARYGRITGAPRWHRSAPALGSSFRSAGAVVVVGLLTWVTWETLTRAPMTSTSRVQTLLLVVAVLLAWLGISALVSSAGRYQRSPLAGTVLILLPVAAVTAFLTAASGPPAPVSVLLDATTASSLIGLQTVRVAGGVFLLAWLGGGVQRPWFCGWAGSIDVVIGVTALPMAWWVSTGSPVASTVGVVWNLLGLLDFVVAVVIVNIDRTVIRDLLHSERPVAVLIKRAILFIFSFAVPVMAILHLLSIRQLI